jgi:hypothetical protein
MKTYKASEVDSSRHFSMAVYGTPKAGKTTFCATAKNCLIINTERGMGSITDKDVDIVDCYTLKDLVDVMRELKTDKKYDVVAIDTMTELSNMFQSEMKGENSLLQKQQWGVLSDKLMKMIQAFRAIDKNKIYLCQQQVVEDRIMPLVSPAKFVPYLLAQVDIIARMGVKEIEKDGIKTTKYFMSAAPSDAYVTGDRFRVLPKAFPPDFEYIKALVKDNKKISIQDLTEERSVM